MRILFISTFYPSHIVGGWEQLAQEINERLQERGCVTHVLASQRGVDKPSFIHIMGHLSPAIAWTASCCCPAAPSTTWPTIGPTRQTLTTPTGAIRLTTPSSTWVNGCSPPRPALGQPGPRRLLASLSARAVRQLFKLHLGQSITRWLRRNRGSGTSNL
jgi:hypothetical protein